MLSGDGRFKNKHGRLGTTAGPHTQSTYKSCMYSFLRQRHDQNRCETDTWRRLTRCGETMEISPPSGGLIFDL